MRIPRTGLLIAFLAVTVTAVVLVRSVSAVPSPSLAPELPSAKDVAWINTPPLALAQLRGQPVLVEFWTFDCSNCRATQPWMDRIHEVYGPKGLTVIGVHSPEFDNERDFAAVKRKVHERGIRYPVMVDNGFHYWKALKNRFWPAFYLIDPQGRIVATRIGELHKGQWPADEFERMIASYAKGND
jgi:thiol-disulfide isomerase/thioredoxin